MNYLIRKIKDEEVCLLKDFLYESIFQKDENNLFPRSVIEKPELSIYIDDFGKLDDLCLVAEVDNKVVGAVWTRILAGDVKGYGNVDKETPEFAISLYKEYRGLGIGTALMKSMIQLLKEKGYKQASLSAQKENYAVKMYRAVGFEVLEDKGEEYIMVYNLKEMCE